MEELNWDITHVLQNTDFTVLEKLISYYSKFREEIAAKVEETIAYEIESREKRASRTSKISELQHELETLKTKIDEEKLEQKKLDKKIQNAVKLQETLQEEVEHEKLKRDSLSIEMIDLQEEAEKRRKHKIATWNAIKRACYIYKQYLDCRIQLINSNDEYEHIQISFFITDADAEDKYFVQLFNSKGHWKVKEIQPELKTEDLKDLKGIVDLHKNSEISDVTAFLCNLRHIFVKYYFNIK
ncbi:structural maintenance of chromosomes protein 4-like [Hylaeus anthracinus]|uniref:structural maintenance of chromosomes protein 4-like n=1 Tax=Hylaeus anthracinus TaxID=313031 RepID=UPI0023B90B26|nr:structural maintenance of chromosomes protein 4-like [Hylaeus anthracinus]